MLQEELKYTLRRMRAAAMQGSADSKFFSSRSDATFVSMQSFISPYPQYEFGLNLV